MKIKTEQVGHLGNKQSLSSLYIAMIRNFEFHFILISFLSTKMENFRASCRDPTGRNPPNVSSSGIFRYSLFRLVAENRKEIKR